MKYSESEIINALKVIKETCEESENCADCPLCISGLKTCGLKYDKNGDNMIPERWQIVSYTPKSLFLH